MDSFITDTCVKMFKYYNFTKSSDESEFDIMFSTIFKIVEEKYPDQSYELVYPRVNAIINSLKTELQ